MNVRARVNYRIIALALVFIGVFCGLTLLAWWIWEPMPSTPMPRENLKFPGHTWGANNTVVTLSVKNVGGIPLSVSEVQVNGTVVDNVAYGGNFTGTTHTLNTGYVGTITITYSFSPGINYEFDVVTKEGHEYTYAATAP